MIKTRKRTAKRLGRVGNFIFFSFILETRKYSGVSLEMMGVPPGEKKIPGPKMTTDPGISLFYPWRSFWEPISVHETPLVPIRPGRSSDSPSLPGGLPDPFIRISGA
jgi:hypothetical protein